MQWRTAVAPTCVLISELFCCVKTVAGAGYTVRSSAGPTKVVVRGGTKLGRAEGGEIDICLTDSIKTVEQFYSSGPTRVRSQPTPLFVKLIVFELSRFILSWLTYLPGTAALWTCLQVSRTGSTTSCRYQVIWLKLHIKYRSGVVGGRASSRYKQVSSWSQVVIRASPVARTCLTGHS